MSRQQYKRLLKNDASPQERDEYARETDAGSANSSAIGTTENTLSRRSVRSGGRGFVLQQPDRPRIVIVDDAADVRRDLRLLLEIAGLEVVGEAADGREAIEKAALLNPDVVVSDLAMPVLDGYAAAAAIRAALPQCRLVALSIHSDSSGSRRTRAAGFDAFVVKGAPLPELLGAIRPLSDETDHESDRT